LFTRRVPPVDFQAVFLVRAIDNKASKCRVEVPIAKNFVAREVGERRKSESMWQENDNVAEDVTSRRPHIILLRKEKKIMWQLENIQFRQINESADGEPQRTSNILIVGLVTTPLVSY
jgi:hypothetical protein